MLILFNRLFGLVIAIGALSGCAATHKYIAHAGQTMDSATTVVAIYGYNMSEANPILGPLMDSSIGHVGLWVAKMAILGAALFLPTKECEVTYQAASGLGWGAAVHNVAILIGAASPPATAVIFAVASVYAGIMSEGPAKEWCVPA